MSVHEISVVKKRRTNEEQDSPSGIESARYGEESARPQAIVKRDDLPSLQVESMPADIGLTGPVRPVAYAVEQMEIPSVINRTPNSLYPSQI
ncbi:MAG: hypothetical protein M5R41_04150 [Bacteroidia bacterium]|nr:hypothetical protein [Bacteroidia bacterium]